MYILMMTWLCHEWVVLYTYNKTTAAAKLAKLVQEGDLDAEFSPWAISPNSNLYLKGTEHGYLAAWEIAVEFLFYKLYVCFSKHGNNAMRNKVDQWSRIRELSRIFSATFRQT